MRNGNYDIFVGTYTDGTESRGIYRIGMDSSGKIINVVLAASARNPSYLCLNGQVLYTVNEYEEGGAAAAYRIDEPHCSILWQSDIVSGGLCHAFYSAAHNFVMLSCYHGGDYYSVDAADGRLLSHAIHTPLNGAVPHAHCAITDHGNKFILCADLGLDTISTYPIKGGKLSADPTSVFHCKKDSGPRQLLFHPHRNILFAVNELDNTVSTFMFNPSCGELRLLSTVPASSMRNHRENYPAGITTTSQGNILYVSNRGADTIAVFHVLPTGLVKSAGESTCGGEFPRHIMLTADEKFLIISNQRSNNIVVCPVDPINGYIGSPTASLDIPAPSCAVEHIW